MSTEENKALERRFWEEWNKQNLAGVDELFAPDFEILHTPDYVKQVITVLNRFTAFPDMHAMVDDVIAEGDKVVVRVTFRGIHEGDFMGIPPTGKRVSFTAIGIDRVKDGKFVEAWWNEDDLGLLQQLGVIPQMAQGGA